MGRRQRKPSVEQYVAAMQAKYLGIEPKEVLGLIDRKSGDYYSLDLFPDQSVVKQSEDDYNAFRAGTAAMNQVADDMRRYYGIGGNESPKVMTSAPPKNESQVAAVPEPVMNPQPVIRSETNQMRKPAPTQSVSPRKEDKTLLRRAGEAIQSMDDAYSAKIANMYTDANPAVQASAYLIGGAHPSFRLGEPDMPDGALKTALKYGVPAANAVPKYVLPAAGVTAAGMALMEIGQALTDNQQTSGTVMP